MATEKKKTDPKNIASRRPPSGIGTSIPKVRTAGGQNARKPSPKMRRRRNQKKPRVRAKKLAHHAKVQSRIERRKEKPAPTPIKTDPFCFSVKCPYTRCKADVGVPCWGRERHEPHPSRVKLAKKLGVI